jgi:hypothetical protein
LRRVQTAATGKPRDIKQDNTRIGPGQWRNERNLEIAQFHVISECSPSCPSAFQELDKRSASEYNAAHLKHFSLPPIIFDKRLMFFGISLIVLIIIVLLALISGQEPLPVGQKVDARQRRR